VTDETILSGTGLTHSFGEGRTLTRVLRGISVSFRRGEVALLTGPSGSGKSTLLAVLSGLLRPDGGTVTALGQDVWAMSDRRRERFRLEHCGYVFQHHNLLGALPARQQIEIVLRWGYGTPAGEARRRTDEILDFLGLRDRADLLPLELSGGEKQRVAIGRALVKKPTLCFADEPTSALDWEHGKNIVGLLRRQATERGGTVLIVSHDPRMEPFADSIHHLTDGQLSPAAPTAQASAAAAASAAEPAAKTAGQTAPASAGGGTA
jgi:putative ABC transport system ATP-binding protein